MWTIPDYNQTVNQKQIFSSAALLIFIAVALAYSPLVDAPYLGDTLTLIGLMPMIMALWAGRADNDIFSRRDLMHQTPTQNFPIKSKRQISPGHLIIGVLLLLVLSFITPMNIHLQFAAFVGGIVLVGFGLSGVTVGARLRLAQTHNTPGQVNALPLLILITLLAFTLRIINLENSLHLWVDEAHFIDGITRLRDNPNTPLLAPMNFIASFTWLHAYLEAHSVAIFGPTLAAPRYISAIFGTLTIPAVYFLTIQLVPRRSLALLAALLLAVFPPHVHFSRLALNNIVDPLFGTLAFAFLLKGIRQQRISSLVMAGIFLALTQYYYEGGKIIFPMMGFIVIMVSLLNKRLHWRHVGLIMIAFLLVVMPLWITLLRGGYPYFPRAEAQRLSGPDAPSLLADDGMHELNRYVEGNLSPAWHHLISQEERNGNAAHYGGGTGLILPMLIPFFLAGMVILLWQGVWIPTGVILLTIFGNSLIMNPDMSARFVVVFPFVVIPTAAGIDWVMRSVPTHQLLRSRNNKSIKSINYIYFLFIVFLAAVQILYYFGPHLARLNEQIRPARDHQDVAWRALDFPPGTQVFLFTDELTFYPHIEILENYVNHDLNLHINHPLHLMLRGNSRLPDNSDLAIFMQPNNRDLLRYLSQIFTIPKPQYSPYNVPADKQYVLYYFPQNSK